MKREPLFWRLLGKVALRYWKWKYRKKSLKCNRSEDMSLRFEFGPDGVVCRSDDGRRFAYCSYVEIERRLEYAAALEPASERETGSLQTKQDLRRNSR